MERSDTRGNRVRYLKDMCLSMKSLQVSSNLVNEMYSVKQTNNDGDADVLLYRGQSAFSETVEHDAGIPRCGFILLGLFVESVMEHLNLTVHTSEYKTRVPWNYLTILFVNWQISTMPLLEILSTGSNS